MKLMFYHAIAGLKVRPKRKTVRPKRYSPCIAHALESLALFRCFDSTKIGRDLKVSKLSASHLTYNKRRKPIKVRKSK